MIRRIFSYALALLLMGTVACSKKDKTTIDDTEQPDAKAQYDESNYGVYKGVFVGSSGVIVINLNNEGTISASLTIDGTNYNFTTTQTIQAGVATTLDFKNGDNSFTFSVSAKGGDPVITKLVVNGHPNAAILVIKELSTTIVRAYEGTYSGDDTGVFNAVFTESKVKAIIRSTATDIGGIASGTVTNGQLSATAGTTDTGATFTGTVSDDKCSGTWTGTFGAKGTWTGVRKL